MGLLFLIIEMTLEVVSFVFLVVDFGLGPFWRVFVPLGAHLLALVLLTVGFTRRWQFTNARHRAWAVVALSVSLPLPLLGFLGFTTLYALFSTRPRGTGELLRDFEQYISYDMTPLDPSERSGDEARFIMEEVDVAPLRDILAGDDIDLKRGAILSLSRLPRSEAVALLKTALSDQSREIRYYAGNALSEMEKEFNDRIFRLVREVERSPTKIEHHLELARLVLDYIETGLLDDTMIGYFGEIGLRALDKASLVAADDPRIRISAGLLNRAVGNLEAARQALEEYIEARPEDADALVALAEVVYETGDMERARAAVETGLQEFPEDSRFEDLKMVLGG